MTLQPKVSSEIRSRLALALDTDSLDEAQAIATNLQPWFGVAKVGLELFSAAGPEAIFQMQALGYRVFADIKLHDIPTTVRKAAHVLGSYGVHYLTVHAQANIQMLEAANEGFLSGYEKYANSGRVAIDNQNQKYLPMVLGVTVLTSDAMVQNEDFVARIERVRNAGCGGVVCAGTDIASVVEIAPTLQRVVPGIRLAGSASHDQNRVTTPSQALENGASLLVIGRTVTEADDKSYAAKQVAREVAASVGVAY